jgi:tagaturonate reductase
VVDAVLADKDFWDADLSALPGFAEAVKINLNLMVDKGVAKVVADHQLNKTEA